MTTKTEITAAAVEYRIEEVKNEFMQRYNLEVGVIIYNKEILMIEEHPTLAELEDLVNIILKSILKHDCPENGIRVKSRERIVVTCRHIFNFIALRYGYTCSSIGRFIDQDHATVLHSKMKVRDLLDSNDEIIMPIYKDVSNEINQFMHHKKSKNESDAGYLI